METLTEKKTGIWTLDKTHAKVGFSAVHLLVSDVEGHFKSFDASLRTAKEGFSGAAVEFTAQVSSIDTQNEQRDAHLQKEDFFHAEKFPVIQFISNSFIIIGENKYKTAGDLTMHGITKKIDLDVIGRLGENPYTHKPIAGFKISGKINRSDFGIGNSVPAFVVGEEITILANAEFIGD